MVSGLLLVFTAQMTPFAKPAASKHWRTSGQSNLTKMSHRHRMSARWRQCARPSNTYFLGPTESTFQMASGSVQSILHSSQQRVPILYTGPPFPHSKLPLSMGIWTPSNTCFLGPTRAHSLNGMSICSVVFAWLTIVSEKWTDYTIPSVIVGLSMCIVLWCGLKTLNKINICWISTACMVHSKLLTEWCAVSSV